jgi:hypothetical protein
MELGNSIQNYGNPERRGVFRAVWEWYGGREIWVLLGAVRRCGAFFTTPRRETQTLQQLS